jgi:hypothetical protein
MTKWGAFLWTALAAAACSIVVTLRVSPLQTDMTPTDAEILRAIAVSSFISLLALSWAAAGIVLLLARLTRYKAQRVTLMIVSVTVSIVLSISMIVLLSP